jgi:sterol desaturase/sphingolipid hydroxylase (fatty acid hydroxylase superfamily)
MAQLETTGYYAFGVPLYLALIGIESLAARRRGAARFSFADSVGNIGAGLGAIVVGLFLGPILIALYEWAFRHFALVHFAPRAWTPWALALVMADFGHYWHHRLDHRVAAFWAVHGVHHQPVEMNFTVGMRHAWFSDLYSFPFYAPLPLLGVPVAHFFIATSILSLHALLTHSAEYDFPSFGLFVTPRSHIVHHAKNPRYVDKNFGAMLSLWDRLFGTHVDLDPAEPPIYGASDGYETHDGARAQWVLVRDLLARVRRARTVGDKLRLLVARPGSGPDAARLSVRSSGAIPRATKLYVAAQLAATALFSSYVFIWRDAHSLALRVASAAIIVASLVTLGGLLDGRRAAWRWEAARVALGAAGLWALVGRAAS